MNSVLKSEKFQDNLKKIRAFLLSKEWMVALSCLAGVITTLAACFPTAGIEIYGTLGFAMIVGVCMVISDDILVGLMPFMLTALIAIKCYDSYDIFIQYKWFAVPLVICLLFHFIVYRKKLVLGGSLSGSMVFVSIAILMGGFGVISAEEYFAPTSLYHMLGLGAGMLFLYILFYSNIQVREYSIIEKLTTIMVITGCFASFMVISYYLININAVIDTGTVIYLQWRNNCSTILMLAMPFAFMRANKKSYATIFGFVFFFAILLTGSRGGMVFGALELVMCIVMFMLYDRRRRLAYFMICLCFLFGFLIFSRQFISFFGYTVDRLFSAISGFLTGEQNEVRSIHYARGINDYLNNPVFGTGLGYMGNRDVHPSKDFALCWYHCEPIQIAASFGTVGILAYGYQFIRRNILLWRKATLFNMTVFLSYMSLEFMSLVNPGIFCPLPYLMLVTVFFAAVEKCDEGERQEKLYIRKKRRLPIKRKTEKV